MKRLKGFTLIELASVVAAVGVLNAVLFPSVRHIQSKVRETALINDIRVFEEAFQRYVTETGAWPDNYNVQRRRTPRGMEDYLPPKWGSQNQTPVGGIYMYETDRNQKGTKISAVIRVRDLGTNQVIMKRADIREFDRKYDDGDISTGRFRFGRGNDPIWVLEE